MKLCEIVRADKTAPDALATAVAVARKIAKVPAVVGVCDGFVGNRMLAQRGKQAEKLLFEGALPQQVDAVVTKFGMPMGPVSYTHLDVYKRQDQQHRELEHDEVLHEHRPDDQQCQHHQ